MAAAFDGIKADRTARRSFFKASAVKPSAALTKFKKARARAR